MRNKTVSPIITPAVSPGLPAVVGNPALAIRNNRAILAALAYWLDDMKACLENPYHPNYCLFGSGVIPFSMKAGLDGAAALIEAKIAGVALLYAYVKANPKAANFLQSYSPFLSRIDPEGAFALDNIQWQVLSPVQIRVMDLERELAEARDADDDATKSRLIAAVEEKCAKAWTAQGRKRR